MITEYLKARGNKVLNPQIGSYYRVVGRIMYSGSIFEIESIDNGFIYLKGYVKPFEVGSIDFYEVL